MKYLGIPDYLLLDTVGAAKMSGSSYALHVLDVEGRPGAGLTLCGKRGGRYERPTDSPIGREVCKRCLARHVERPEATLERFEIKRAKGIAIESLVENEKLAWADDE